MTPDPPRCAPGGAGVLLLVGAGHAHLHLLRHAAGLVAAGYRVRLLAPGAFRYSGVATAASVGELSAGAGQVDVTALAAGAGVEHHRGVLRDIDVGARTVTADDGTVLPFDLVSFNIGSVIAPSTMAIGEGVLRVKPLSSLAGLESLLRAPELAGRARVSVVGAGSSGLELAAQLSLRDDVARVELWESGPRIGPDLPGPAARRVERLLTRRGVHVHTGCVITRLDARSARYADATRSHHDLAVLATGLAAPELVTRTGLGDRDGIPVRATLQHRDHEHVYAAGDCAHFLPGPLRRIGVHGVRQGPVLHASLLARAAGRPLPVYTPQARALSVLDLGAGIGLAVRGRRWWLGRSALLLKRWIDRRWLRAYPAAGRPDARDGISPSPGPAAGSR